jgi:hypothetical protein
MPEEKRDAERVNTPGQITGEVTIYQPMTVLDISELGAQIETTFQLQLEALHEFRLSLGSRSVVVKGRTVHCEIGELRDGVVVYRAGVEFVEVSQHAQLAIDAFVEARRSAQAARPPIVDAEIADDGV